ncbi:protein IQ-DOMAIN 14-like [Dorcoceras hygrometricum]|uniref:Protein IQ-DOMAIN 14-like n=1 Tax=Dorcoceras hygrometricum TaxID=472368 RepID=A0A2Z7A9D4_9LAMI|nr:protein IQ-DOMAIN 14-like [Dorcoceras hygrometricum]
MGKGKGWFTCVKRFFIHDSKPKSDKARKALSALKGIVKLQAVVRGELVRCRLVKNLASRYLSAKSQLERPHHSRAPYLLDCLKYSEKRRSHSGKEGIISEELRERENYQNLQGSMNLTPKENRKSSWFDQEYEEHQHEETETSNHLPLSTYLRLRTTRKQELMEELSSPFSLPRRSFCHMKQKSIGEDGSLPNSPVFPAYMAATESAKAKSRSLSTPRQRLRFCDTYSGQHSPYKVNICLSSSCNGQTTNKYKKNIMVHQD